MNRPDHGLEGKTALVTGGSRGIGLALARELLAQGVRVAICARKEAGLAAARAELEAVDGRAGGAGSEETAGERLLAVVAHVAEEEQVDRLFDTVLERFGRLDILINNVGMNLMTPSVVDSDIGAWRKIMDTNLTGTYLCSRRAAQAMREEGRGKIVSVSSIAGRLAAPGMGIYGIAKAGIEALTRSLAMELAPQNIQVNAVAPGMVKTAFSAPFWTSEPIHRQIVAGIPAGRLAEPDDIAQAVLFLVSPAADYITGQTLVVDGGTTAVWAGL